uniref:Secreted protein n=1 Tax=Panstrongylus lignarius TaxID=156445 RepID=A0A224XTJ9_9HEMI
MLLHLELFFLGLLFATFFCGVSGSSFIFSSVFNGVPDTSSKSFGSSFTSSLTFLAPLSLSAVSDFLFFAEDVLA